MSCEHCATPPTESGNGWKSEFGRSEVRLRRLPAECFDAIITDPPYNAGASGLLGRLQSSAAKYQNTSTANKLPTIAGDSMLPDAWRLLMTMVAIECFRVAKPGSTLLSFCDWRSASELISIWGAAGFQIRGLPVWDKGQGTRPQRNGFRSQTEFILWGRKPGKETRDKDVYLPGVFQCSTKQTKKVHVTEKPVSLIDRLLEIVPPGGSVLDPFQGSGTTGVAAIARGLTYHGIEAVDEYFAVAVSRLREAEAAATETQNAGATAKT